MLRRVRCASLRGHQRIWHMWKDQRGLLLRRQVSLNKRKAMREQKSSLWERLKICWSVLTKKNYIYLGMSNRPFVFNKRGMYVGLNRRKFCSYSCVTYDYEFETKEGKTNLHDFMWERMGSLSKLAQEGKI